MSAHRFRLQNVLDYRTSMVDRLKLELSAMQMRLQGEQERLATLGAAEQRAMADLAAQQAAVLDVPRLMQLTEHLHLMSLHIAEQRGVVERLQAETDTLQQSVVEHNQDVKALEKLRDRHGEEHQREEARQERIESSEVAMYQFRRAQATL